MPSSITINLLFVQRHQFMLDSLGPHMDCEQQNFTNPSPSHQRFPRLRHHPSQQIPIQPSHPSQCPLHPPNFIFHCSCFSIVGVNSATHKKKVLFSEIMGNNKASSPKFSLTSGSAPYPGAVMLSKHIPQKTINKSYALTGGVLWSFILPAAKLRCKSAGIPGPLYLMIQKKKSHLMFYISCWIVLKNKNPRTKFHLRRK